MSRFNKIQLLSRQFESRADAVRFDFESRCVCALFARHARGLGAELPEGWGIVVEFVPPQEPVGMWRDGNPTRVSLHDDVSDVLKLDPAQRKERFLDLIVRAMQATYGSELPRGFLEAAERTRQEGYRNVWEWTKGRKRDPGRAFKTAVFVVHELDHFTISLTVRDKKENLVHEACLVRGEQPDEMLIDAWLGELKWETQDAIVLVPKLSSKAPIRIDVSHLPKPGKSESVK